MVSAFIDLVIKEWPHNKPSIIYNTFCLILFTGQLTNDPKTNSVKYLTHSVGLNHLSNTKYNPNQVSEIANT